MNRKFISKSNRVLRKILNSKENLDVLKDFIEAFLEIQIEEIKLNPYLKVKSNHLPSEENFGIADVRVRLKNQEEFNIGIQFIDGYYAQNKMLLYYAQIHANQLEYQDNRKIARTITINILDFNYLESEHYFNKIEIPSKMETTIELYVLELPKFMANSNKFFNKKEAWMTYLCGEVVEEIAEVLKRFNKIKKLDRLLEAYWKNEVME
ncbi:MAG: hypothetical protein HFJ35_02105 [Clostridia bacterium]|nr:hypothetical protein [Clostridia bacterium]